MWCYFKDGLCKKVRGYDEQFYKKSILFSQTTDIISLDLRNYL